MFNRHWPPSFLPSVLLVLLGVYHHSFAQGGSLYGIEQLSGSLYRISPATAASTLIGSTGVSDLRCLELWADGFLYAFTATGSSTLYRIDPTTAAATAVGPLGIGFVFEGGLAVDDHGTAYGANQNNFAMPFLFTINLGTGAATLGAPLSSGGHDLNGLSWRDDGQLIALDRVTNALLEINHTTGAITFLAPVTATVGGLGGMAVRGGRGYFSTSGPNLVPTGSHELWTFDLYTGAQALIGSLGPAITGDGISGLSGDCRLDGDYSVISLSAGGAQQLSLASPGTPNQLYVVAGTTAGAAPGFALSGLLVPLNIDGPNGYFNYTITFLNSPPLVNSFGFLGSGGTEVAHFALPAGAPPALAGITVHHAFAVADVPGTGVAVGVSNPVSVSLVPEGSFPPALSIQRSAFILDAAAPQLPSRQQGKTGGGGRPLAET